MPVFITWWCHLGFTAQKCGIFTRDNNISSSHIKRSLLLLLHNKSHLLQQKSAIGTGVYIINRTFTWPLGKWNFSSHIEKYLSYKTPCSHIISSMSFWLKGLTHTMSSKLTKLGSVLKQEKIRPTNLASITWYIAWVRRSYHNKERRMVSWKLFLCVTLKKIHISNKSTKQGKDTCMLSMIRVLMRIMLKTMITTKDEFLV